MVPQKSQEGAQLFDNEQEREEAQCETLSTQLRNHHLYIYVSILCTHLSNRYQLNDVYIVSPSITTTCMVPVIFAQCGRETFSSTACKAVWRKTKNKNKREKAKRKINRKVKENNKRKEN